MENKRRLHRRCEFCQDIFPIARQNEEVTGFYDGEQVWVRWQTDPFAEEIHEDFGCVKLARMKTSWKSSFMLARYGKDLSLR